MFDIEVPDLREKRELETWQQEKKGIGKLRRTGKSLGVFDEFMEYLDNQANAE